MPTSPTSEVMSSRDSRSPPAELEEPRKKGARGGKRSVTHLSKAQLARKRANDREAQRNIRQRTKEHIETLEKKVRELESQTRPNGMDEVLQRNRELELEISNLKSQLSSTTSTPSQTLSELSEDVYASSNAESYLAPSDQALGWVATGVQPSMALTTSGGYMNDSQSFPATSGPIYDQDLFATTPIPIWNDSQIFGGSQQSQGNKLSTFEQWMPFHPTFNHPSRFSEFQMAGFKDLVNNPSSPTTTSWQSQPSIYAWQISTKLKSPVTYIDQLMFSTIRTQRQIAMNSELTGKDLLGPDLPEVNALFNQQATLGQPPSSLAAVMRQYAKVLTDRGFALIPEMLASFMCMYRFVQWQISPTNSTFNVLYKWQAPCTAQLEIEHPAWMDLPPWSTFREKVIMEQSRYDNPEFQMDYARNLNVNFPYEASKAVDFDNGQIKVSKLLEAHLSDISNMSMRKPFADKYPEFRDVCRFELE